MTSPRNIFAFFLLIFSCNFTEQSALALLPRTIARRSALERCAIPPEFLTAHEDPQSDRTAPAKIKTFCPSNEVESQLNINPEAIKVSKEGPFTVKISGHVAKKRWKLLIDDREVILSKDGQFTILVSPGEPLTQVTFLALGPKDKKENDIFILYVPALENPLEKTLAQTAWRYPGISAGSQTGFASQWGDLFAGLAYTPATPDQKSGGSKALGAGSAVFGMGFGNAEESIGGEVSLDILSFYNVYPSSVSQLFTTMPDFNTGGLSLKLNHIFKGGWAVAIGSDNLISWQPAAKNAIDPVYPDFYGAVSTLYSLQSQTDWFSSLAVSAGLGNGRFVSFLPVNVSLAKTSVRPFGAAALRINDPVTFIVDWYGDGLAMAASITPFRSTAIYLNLVASDLVGGGGEGVIYFLSLAYGFSFL